MKLILASGSPRRREMLEQLGLRFEVASSDIEEKRRPGEPVELYVERLAREKAETVASKHPDAWVIAADTVVWLAGEVLEKPVDAADAADMLGRIAGREHVVYTGTVLRNVNIGWSEATVTATAVRIAPMTEDEISWYVATGEPMDKAGAYAAQGVGALFVESVSGNYNNVIGLPLAILLRMMRDAGIDPAKISESGGISTAP